MSLIQSNAATFFKYFDKNDKKSLSREEINKQYKALKKDSNTAETDLIKEYLIQDLFLDIDNNGEIDNSEFQLFADSKTNTMTPESLNKAINLLNHDANMDGEINHSDRSFLEESLQKRHQIQKYFDPFDKNSDGKLTREELNEQNKGPNLFDLNNDGTVDEVEFRSFKSGKDSAITKDSFNRLLNKFDQLDGIKDGNFTKGLKAQEKMTKGIKQMFQKVDALSPEMKPQLEAALNDLNLFEVNKLQQGTAGGYYSNVDSLTLDFDFCSNASEGEIASTTFHELVHKVQNQHNTPESIADEAQAFYYQIKFCQQGLKNPALLDSGQQQMGQIIDKMEAQGKTREEIYEVLGNWLIKNGDVYRKYEGQPTYYNQLPDFDKDGVAG